MNDLRARFAKAVADHTGLELSAVEAVVARPPDLSMGVLAFPCFPLAKTLRKAPPAIAAELAAAIAPPEGSELLAAGGYLNLRLKPGMLARGAIGTAWSWQTDSVVTGSGEGRVVLVDYSSPNAG